jgi:hypothetical protein
VTLRAEKEMADLMGQDAAQRAPQNRIAQGAGPIRIGVAIDDVV